jgi:hypothetical protein
LRDIGYYADDATSFFQNRPPLIGKEAIVEFLKADWRGTPIKLNLQPMKYSLQVMVTRL